MDPAELGRVKANGCFSGRIHRYSRAESDSLIQSSGHQEDSDGYWVTMSDNTEKSEDSRRDDGLLRMLKMRPKTNRELRLGKPRNPRKKPKTKKPGR